MTTKIRYTLSEVERDKDGAGWHVRAVPNAYGPTLRVDFNSEEEALTWLDRDSVAWLAKLEAHSNSEHKVLSSG